MSLTTAQREILRAATRPQSGLRRFCVPLSGAAKIAAGRRLEGRGYLQYVSSIYATGHVFMITPEGLAALALEDARRQPCAACDCPRRAHRLGCKWCLSCQRRGGKCSQYSWLPPPATIYCPKCKKLHVDEGPWARHQHRTHLCVDDAAGKGCGNGWRIDRVCRGVMPHPEAPRSFPVTHDLQDAPMGARIFIDEYGAEYERGESVWRMV